MCKFFSLVSNGDSEPLYFNAKLRQQVKEGKLNYDPDSHTSIADYFGYKGDKEDVLNKYEYNPLTRVFTIDQKNNPKDDSKDIKKFCLGLDFKLIVPELIIHPIVHPFEDFSVTKVSKQDLELLKQWKSVRDSVWNGVGDSVGKSVGKSVGDSVRDSVWNGVGDSVWNGVGKSVRDSVWTGVGKSLRDSVWAYISSFFTLENWKYIKHEKGVNPFQSCIDLWNKGIVPSYDGKIWRLHGKNGKVI